MTAQEYNRHPVRVKEVTLDMQGLCNSHNLQNKVCTLVSNIALHLAIPLGRQLHIREENMIKNREENTG